MSGYAGEEERREFFYILSGKEWWWAPLSALGMERDELIASYPEMLSLEMQIDENAMTIYTNVPAVHGKLGQYWEGIEMAEYVDGYRVLGIDGQPYEDAALVLYDSSEEGRYPMMIHSSSEEEEKEEEEEEEKEKEKEETVKRKTLQMLQKRQQQLQKEEEGEEDVVVAIGEVNCAYVEQLLQESRTCLDALMPHYKVARIARIESPDEYSQWSVQLQCRTEQCRAHRQSVAAGFISLVNYRHWDLSQLASRTVIRQRSRQCYTGTVAAAEDLGAGLEVDGRHGDAVEDMDLGRPYLASALSTVQKSAVWMSFVTNNLAPLMVDPDCLQAEHLGSEEAQSHHRRNIVAKAWLVLVPAECDWPEVDIFRRCVWVKRQPDFFDIYIDLTYHAAGRGLTVARLRDELLQFQAKVVEAYKVRLARRPQAEMDRPRLAMPPDLYGSVQQQQREEQRARQRPRTQALSSKARVGEEMGASGTLWHAHDVCLLVELLFVNRKVIGLPQTGAGKVFHLKNMVLEMLSVATNAMYAKRRETVYWKEKEAEEQLPEVLQMFERIKRHLQDAQALYSALLTHMADLKVSAELDALTALQERLYCNASFVKAVLGHFELVVLVAFGGQRLQVFESMVLLTEGIELQVNKNKLHGKVVSALMEKSAGVYQLLIIADKVQKYQKPLELTFPDTDVPVVAVLVGYLDWLRQVCVYQGMRQWTVNSQIFLSNLGPQELNNVVLIPVLTVPTENSTVERGDFRHVPYHLLKEVMFECIKRAPISVENLLALVIDGDATDILGKETDYKLPGLLQNASSERQLSAKYLVWLTGDVPLLMNKAAYLQRHGNKILGEVYAPGKHNMEMRKVQAQLNEYFGRTLSHLALHDQLLAIHRKVMAQPEKPLSDKVIWAIQTLSTRAGPSQLYDLMADLTVEDYIAQLMDGSLTLLPMPVKVDDWYCCVMSEMPAMRCNGCRQFLSVSEVQDLALTDTGLGFLSLCSNNVLSILDLNDDQDKNCSIRNFIESGVIAGVLHCFNQRQRETCRNFIWLVEGQTRLSSSQQQHWETIRQNLYW